MLSTIFYNQALFCTSHPWEVIGVILTLTVSMISVALSGDAQQSKICGWNYVCSLENDVLSSDVIILSIARCLAAAYIYLQFRKLDALGCKYLLGLAGLLSVFFSMSFSAAFIHLLGYELQGLADSLPFFLLLLDLSKVTALAKYSLANSSQDTEIKETVAKGIAILGPAMTLDIVVEVLLIAIGCLSGIPMLEVICCFGCVSLLVHYVVFMTFFPGVLCLILELNQLRSLPLALKAKKVDIDTPVNPIAQRVKLVMSAGLVLVHVYSRIVDTPAVSNVSSLFQENRRVVPVLPLWQFYLKEFFEVTPQKLITFVCVLVICLKYIFYDSVKKTEKVPTPSSSGSESTSPIKMNGSVSFLAAPGLLETRCTRRFTVGNGDDDESLEMDLPPRTFDKQIQTDKDMENDAMKRPNALVPPASLNLIFPRKGGIEELTDEEILLLIKSKKLQQYRLEDEFRDLERAVHIRRSLILQDLVNKTSLEELPFRSYDYSLVKGTCCENVIGYVPVPIGVAGPLLLDGESHWVPLSTTEGCLVASANRGCRAITMSGGARTRLTRDGMTRAPIVEFSNIDEMDEAKTWVVGEGFAALKKAFDTTSSFARLKSIFPSVVGDELHLRFEAKTGDAMGMNMVCKGTEKALRELQEKFPKMRIISLSGNFCTDKKPSAVNWILGRGKSVVCEAIITEDVLKNVLKTSLSALIELNNKKNLEGSALAGSIGGCNAHAANIVAAVFLATGQDIAQVVESSACLTKLKPDRDNPVNLKISCTMPCVEVGTVGGGTNLPAQMACLKMLNVQGPSSVVPGANAQKLARVVCGAVLAAELSLLSALTSGDLVKSHMKHNRSKLNVSRPTPVGSPLHHPVASSPEVLCLPGHLLSPCQVEIASKE
ncbi:3-hydroxy-3-methylglutaryl-coenzyme A reductase-like [Paramacrobiotus metropolitanus]|uniref:3-hydroxy-3-methylglutaryl-coenzyme A reductase-like n=1 Tax=Paramacrobiotus metropolitanus TaxID=2943436 RepID=UPI002445F0BC|nr:3-hydroxy-3-methylglutaryl-coenzyme A reductase-like [Paramacrobiotus metropolitanus]